MSWSPEDDDIIVEIPGFVGKTVEMVTANAGVVSDTSTYYSFMIRFTDGKVLEIHEGGQAGYMTYETEE